MVWDWAQAFVFFTSFPVIPRWASVESQWSTEMLQISFCFLQGWIFSMQYTKKVLLQYDSSHLIILDIPSILGLLHFSCNLVIYGYMQHCIHNVTIIFVVMLLCYHICYYVTCLRLHACIYHPHLLGNIRQR